MSQKFPYKAFGRRLSECRRQTGVTLRQLGDACGVTAGTCSHWERGRTSPGAHHLQVIANELGCDMNWLITGVQKQVIDISDMWPAHIETLNAAVDVLHRHEVRMDKQWQTVVEEVLNEDFAKVVDPPWYAEE